jgi:Zn-dependent protease with chaperone function
VVTGQPPAGWYADPNGRPLQRYWDGRAWTASTRGAAPPRPMPAIRRPEPAPPALSMRSSPAPAQGGAVAAPRVRTGEDTRASMRPGLWPTLLAVATLIPAAIGALVIVAPIAYGLNLAWPIWGAAVPFAVWAAAALVTSWPQETIQRVWYGYRDPTAEEHRRLGEPSRRALRRLGVATGRYRLMIVKSDEPNAPATTGRTVVITSYAAGSLPPEQVEAILVHELSHHIGLHAVPVFCYTQLTLPIRALWWPLTRIWRPVRRMWRVAVRWHTPFGFLVTFLLAIAVAVIFMVSAIPAGIAVIGAALSRFSIDRTEFHADTAVTSVGLGAQLLAALEKAIETNHVGTDRTGRLLALPPLAVRRAQRLRRLAAAR